MSNKKNSNEDYTKDYKDFIKGIKNNDKIETLKLSKRTFHCLVCVGDIRYISELIEMSEKDLLNIIFIGKKTVKEIKEKLAERDLKLIEDEPVQKKLENRKK